MRWMNNGDWARPVVHWEIVARDVDAQVSFYRDLFGWDIGADGLHPVGPGIGGPEPGPGGHFMAGQTPGVVLYVQVRRLDETLERVPGLGGRVTSDPFDVPGGPTIAFIDDPEGNRVGLVQQ